LAFIVSALAGIEKPVKPNGPGSIDGEEADPYSVFTESHTDLWESFGKRFIAAGLSASGGLSFAAAMEQLPEELDRAGFSLPTPKRLVRALRAGQSRLFQDLRAYGHDRKQESTGGNPPSGQEKPELSSLVLFTPWNNMHHKIPSGDETYTENQSWKCAFN
jgi:hypothetical protein